MSNSTAIIGVQYGVGGALGFGLTLVFGYLVLYVESTSTNTKISHQDRLLRLWIVTLPW